MVVIVHGFTHLALIPISFIYFPTVRSTFWDDLSILTQLSGDLGSSVVLLGFIMNILYFGFYVFPALFRMGRGMFQP